MIKTGYRNLKRSRSIVQVLLKYGFSFVVEKLKIDGIAYKMPLTPNKEIQNMSTGERVRRAIEELGPTFVKLGQIMSTRTDLLDPDIIEELSKLQNNVKSFDIKEARDTFVSEIGVEIEEAFDDFNEIPVGSASIGQAYVAKLKNGKDVIVKIQRPNIESIIKSDLEMLHLIGKVIEEYYKETVVDFSEVIEEFSITIMRELDYTFESRNCEKFREIFKNDTHVYIPKIYWDMSSKKVLVMEKINGISVSDMNSIKSMGWDTKEIANVGAMSFMKQVFFSWILSCRSSSW
jgi:ubiquinone biosynthesis protein